MHARRWAMKVASINSVIYGNAPKNKELVIMLRKYYSTESANIVDIWLEFGRHQTAKIGGVKTQGQLDRESRKKFYASREWYELRYKVLLAHGATCCLCGASRKDGIVIHVDHIKQIPFPGIGT